MDLYTIGGLISIMGIVLGFLVGKNILGDTEMSWLQHLIPVFGLIPLVLLRRHVSRVAARTDYLKSYIKSD